MRNAGIANGPADGPKRENLSARYGADHTVRSQFYTPPPQFDGCFTSFYHVDLDAGTRGTLQDYLQPEWGNLRFFAGSCPSAEIGVSRVSGARFTATGPSALPCRFELGNARMWGIGLLPLGWARLIAADASALANTICDGAAHPAFAKFNGLSPVLCDPEVPIEEQLAAIAATMEHLMQPNRDEPKIQRIHTALVSGQHIAVAELADACNMSIRTLERMCHRYFGFTPKLLMRRQRFMRSLTSYMLHSGQKGGARWTEAMDGDYHDQAQFTREFTQFMTMTPSKYAGLDHPILASFMEARARVWGSAAQTLDRPARGSEG
ncbi:helix-turn-helix domain-containing protein [Qipengyuania sp. ASV99]|uniref:helix-turn-helix domain-containing protein n=1 Tax=Qipengyuania sp. ASV99 TaxID=3399681 RepID=UPI003A4C5D0C